MKEREYVVLEHWSAYIEVVVSAHNQDEAIAKAKRIVRSVPGDPEYDQALTTPLLGEPTGKYEVRRA